MFGVLGVVGVPLAFGLVMAVMRLFMVGYVAVGKHVRHGAPFYAQLARGLNPAVGLAGAGVAFVGYNALQISLFGLIGTKAVELLDGRWWVWALVAGLLVLAVGQYPGRKVARVVGLLLALEIGVMVLFTAAGFSQPAGGQVSTRVFAPSALMVAGAVAGVLVFAVASFAGVESVLAYAEEATSDQAVARAARWAVLFCGVLYAVAAWAYITWLGLDNVGKAAEDASQPLVLLSAMFGTGITKLAIGLLLTSVLAAQVAFHAIVARYVFALARERVLPARWGAFSRGAQGGAPLGGSAVQAATSVVVVAGFMAGGADPMTMFTWLSTTGALCILLLLTLASWSALRFFEKGLGGAEPEWLRRTPFAGAIVGAVAVVFMASNLGTLLDTPPGSAKPWLIAVPIVAFAGTGLLTGAVLRRTHRDIYNGISYGVPDPILVRDDRLAGVEL
ncbi:amino acid transporter [Paractinoplanes rishiriensis]|uniref:Amino acid transporter n=2 Tax=Paractinoplanes rishiriensis TaxID=1050105 RepID=A0A919K7R2_9ACTN|nr:amino acid transporter [Actinoplanes rishiriensis]